MRVSVASSRNGQSPATSETANAYLWGDGALLAQSSVTGSASWSSASTATYGYGAGAVWRASRRPGQRGGDVHGAGDTLAGIAAALWGDGALWYKLAAAIGYGVAKAFDTGAERTQAAMNLGAASNEILLGLGGMQGAGRPYLGNQFKLNIVNGENGVHANSRLSERTTYLYELQTKTGEFLKYGISVNPEARYPLSFMKDKDIYRITSGTRADMLGLER